MSALRKELQEALCHYTADTLSYINKVKEFCGDLPQWIEARMTELTTIMEKIDLDDLTAVLQDTLGGLEKLDCFLDAVEKLAVTSLHVFIEENQVLHLPQEISGEQIQAVISSAREICPQLLKFKRDASVFFLPKLQNVEVLSYQLDKYIQTTQTICDKLEKSDISMRITTETLVDQNVGSSEEDMQKMLYHINQLEKIRMDPHFRVVFLFQEKSCSGFITEFTERQPRMQQFLKDLEEVAVQLDRMNKRAKISSVAGSSVGAVGGVLSIVGLALIPVTAGLSLGLLVGGTALGITSGVNSAVTTATEISVNYTKQKKASEVFQSFMEDVQILQEHLEEVSSQIVPEKELSDIDVAGRVGKVGTVAFGVVKKSIDLIDDAASAAKLLKNKGLIAGAGKMMVQEGKSLRDMSRMASDIPDIGQAAVKGSLALSKSARAGLIAFNALFLGMDIFFICKDSIGLAKGSETEVSQFIRARAALWSSEMDSWQKIHDSLCKGLLTSEKNRAVLETPFYP